VTKNVRILFLQFSINYLFLNKALYFRPNGKVKSMLIIPLCLIIICGNKGQYGFELDVCQSTIFLGIKPVVFRHSIFYFS
jgi:hypothetical protein